MVLHDHDRCKTWQGPFKFDVEGVDGISTRTDLIPLGPRDCLMFGSCGKRSDHKEGRVFCARTTDGGLTWKLQGYIGDEPPKGGFAIMPSSVRTPGGALLTTIRMGKPDYTIQLWRSDDLGKTWSKVSDVTGNIGGNPPATVLLPDGRLSVTYGYRRKPAGIRARISADEGKNVDARDHPPRRRLRWRPRLPAQPRSPRWPCADHVLLQRPQGLGPHHRSHVLDSARRRHPLTPHHHDCFIP